MKMEHLKVVEMPAQQFADIRRAASEQFGDEWKARFKAWMHGKYFKLTGYALNADIAEDQQEKWTSNYK